MNSVKWVVMAVLLFGMTAWADPLQLTIYATRDADSVILRWVGIPDATEYWVYAADGIADEFEVIGGSETLQYVDADKAHATQFYRVEAWKYDGGYVQLAASDTVGYFAIETPIHGYYAFGLPGLEFLDLTEGNVPVWCTRSFKPSDILDEQATCGIISTADRVIRQGGNYGFRNADANCAWANTLETSSQMRKSAAYWFQNWWEETPRLVLAGVMHPCSALVVDSAVVNASQYKPYSWATVRNLPRDEVGATLLRDGFIGGSIVTSDKVIEQGAGFMYYDTQAGEWRGTLTEIEPFHAYWIQNKHATGFTYRWRP